MPITASRLLHALTIERPVYGADDEYGQPTRTYQTLSTVRGLPQPKSLREMAAVHQAGSIVGDWTVFLNPTDLDAADRIVHDPALCGAVNDLPAGVLEPTGVRNAAGVGHHLEVDARWVDPAEEAGS
jgi:hypothetical protein